MHYDNWVSGVSNKLNHPLFHCWSGTGTGESRAFSMNFLVWWRKVCQKLIVWTSLSTIHFVSISALETEHQKTLSLIIQS